MRGVHLDLPLWRVVAFARPNDDESVFLSGRFLFWVSYRNRTVASNNGRSSREGRCSNNQVRWRPSSTDEVHRGTMCLFLVRWGLKSTQF